jgi:hypothetical protein
VHRVGQPAFAFGHLPRGVHIGGWASLGQLDGSAVGAGRG